ncbi:P-loop containing nucleoside triphosphate hydrolase protein [Phyllosticta capitalensis]|uniref:P-loop containing nucleoside triphosphate hydrolase protein n=1 Tax=Phyllosticta capitalensis TaxID=121624 RepID=UPI00312FA392
MDPAKETPIAVSTSNGNTKLEPPTAGMTPNTKHLYRNGYYDTWFEHLPETRTCESAKFALVVRRQTKSGDTDGPEFELHSITVQSPLIKAQLDPVFVGYRGINTDVKKLDFKAPFHEFFYRWKEFLKAEPPKSDPIGRKHYKLLFDVISLEIVPHLEQIDDLLKNHVISYNYLWTLFEPGTEVYSRDSDGQDRLYLLDNSDYVEYRGIFEMSCRFIDTTGESFGYQTASLNIDKFQGLKPISELNVLPSSLKSGITEIRARLTERGRKFEGLQGFHFKSYTGKYQLARVPLGGSRICEGRMIIDCSSFEQYYGRYAGGSHNEGDADEDPAPLDIQTLQLEARQARQKIPAATTSLAEKHYTLCSPHVKGFCLKAKEWATFYVDNVEEVAWNTGAFDKLVLPNDYKRVIWAFVEAQLSRKDDFDDVIKGKGKGVIMLLSGAPGTGKTLTAESVSEAMKKPLYSMSAGELGTTADDVERNLGRVLELSTKWGTVLLLDECDVFLEKRSSLDLARNKFVAVFLRLLEYYQGVMFLTTNRVEQFDPAFESRIHLTINYPNLDASSRRLIWRTFVMPDEKKSQSVLTEGDLDELTAVELNGRQIKNVVKTARLLAASENRRLSYRHLQTVLRVRQGQTASPGGDAVGAI